MVQLCTHSELWHSTLRIPSRMVAGLSGVIFSAKFPQESREERPRPNASVGWFVGVIKRRHSLQCSFWWLGTRTKGTLLTEVNYYTLETKPKLAANRHYGRVFISKARDVPNKSKKKGCRERSRGKTKNISVAKKNNTIRLGHKWMEVVTNTLVRMENHKGQDSLESQRIKWSPSGLGMKLNVIVRTQEKKSWQGHDCESSTQRTEGRETPLYQLKTSGHLEILKQTGWREPQVARKEKSLFWYFFKNLKYSNFLKNYY